MSASGLNLVSGKAARIGGKRRGSWVDEGEEDDEKSFGGATRQYWRGSL
jgi:hypothetical protein